MEKSIIDKIFFYDDRINTIVGQSEEYEELFDKWYALYEKLTATLNGEQKKQFDEFNNYHDGMLCEAEDRYFQAGMKFGLQLAFRCFSDF